MVKTLSRHGNSLALVLDRGVLDLLNIDSKTPLEITTDGQVLIVAPARNGNGDRKFKEAITWGNRRYGKALKKLAG